MFRKHAMVAAIFWLIILTKIIIEIVALIQVFGSGRVGQGNSFKGFLYSYIPCLLSELGSSAGF